MYINPAQINKIYIRGTEPYRGTSSYEEARPERKWFWGLFKRSAKPAGFYDWHREFKTLQQMASENSARFIQDGKLMEMAKVSLVFSHPESQSIYFKTNEEAEEFVDGIIRKYNLNLEQIRMIN